MDDEELSHYKFAFSLVEPVIAWMDLIVLIGTGKDKTQRSKLTDIEQFAANIMLMIAINKIASFFRKNPAELHLFALSKFWEGVYGQEDLMSIQDGLIEYFNELLKNDKEILENIAEIFWDLLQNHKDERLEELGAIYRMWVNKLSA